MSEPKRLRVGVRVTGGKQWIAGLHYLKNLFIALRNAKQDIDLVLYAAWETDISELQQFSEFSKEILEFPEEDRYKDRNIVPFLQKQNLDCLFASADYGPDLGIPLVSWLFDFQHKDLPELFPEYDLKIREEMFQYVFDYADIIILSSNHAAQACRKFYPSYAGKTRVMPFVAHIADQVFETDPSQTVKRYNLPAKFIFLPNQFWKHKNHEVVIDALNQAVREEPSVTVVCSGATHDPRDRFYVPYLRSKIQMLGLENNIKLLGLIPEEDVSALMRGCISILQPSLYEGWSTVVEQAKSLGKPILLSDIEVHKEQNPPAGQYFQADDAAELARLLVSTTRAGQPGPDKKAEAEARQSVFERSVTFGKGFRSIVGETIDKFHDVPAERDKSKLLV